MTKPTAHDKTFDEMVKVLPAKKQAEIRKNSREQDEFLEKVRNDPWINENVKLWNNYHDHTALLRNLGKTFDPITGSDWKSLKWPSGLNLQQAQAKAAEKVQEHQKVPHKTHYIGKESRKGNK